MWHITDFCVFGILCNAYLHALPLSCSGCKYQLIALHHCGLVSSYPLYARVVRLLLLVVYNVATCSPGRIFFFDDSAAFKFLGKFPRRAVGDTYS